MNMDRERWPVVASRRFGLGARPGEIASYRSDPRGAVLAQLDPKAALLGDPELLSSPEAIRRWWAFSAEEKMRREAPQPKPEAVAPMAAPAAPPPPAGSTPPQPAPPPAAMPPNLPEQLYRAEVVARLARQSSTTTPLVERLVNFWSNHFCVSTRKGPNIRCAVGAYEREAIRPHVLGRFHDMVMASARHPVMLSYLDNSISVGPGSKAGLRTKKGLNENLGREILELHTLGADGGYSQADVTAFAAALTGWGVVGPQAKDSEPGTFNFDPARHQPGSVHILGKPYDQGGVEQAEAALADFARHPMTARHISRKLVRHFVGDGAPGGLVDRLAVVFRDTDGDLAAVTRSLVEAAEAWSAPPAKILSPWDFLIASGRMLGIDWSYGEANRMLNLFGQPVWSPNFPQGWSDDDDEWAAPSSLLELLDACAVLARRNAGDRNVSRLADETLGAFLHPRTRQAIARSETPEVALTLLLVSPDFLRR